MRWQAKQSVWGWLCLAGLLVLTALGATQLGCRDDTDPLDADPTSRPRVLSNGPAPARIVLPALDEDGTW